MNRAILPAFLFPALLVTMLLACGCNNDPRLVIPTVQDPTPAAAGDFEGSTSCRTCHQSIHMPLS